MRKTSAVRARRRTRKVMPPTLRYRSKSNSAGRTRKGASSRLRMRPWLEKLLDNQECSILRWEDRDLKKFSIAWRHASSHGFDASRHGDLFYMWAHHTGKQKANTSGDHSSNKSTFRCALHSLKDCIELTKKGDKRGEGAKRTYQFIDPGHHLYDRKRKRTSQRGNRMQLKEESVSSPDLQEESSNHSEYIVCEADSAAMNIAASSPDIPEPSDESSAFVSSTINNDLVIPPASSVITTMFDFTSTDVAVSSGQDLNYRSMHEVLSTTPTLPTLWTELQPNGVISVSIRRMDCNDDEVKDITCKEEPTTQRIPNFSALEVKDTYEELDCINNRSLCCGGNVKVKHIKQESLSQPEFQIDYSLLKNLPPQQLLQPIGRFRVAASSGPDYECPIVEACVDVTTEHGDVNDLEQSVTVNSIFQHNQNDDQSYRVLTELQPYIEDEPYAAMLEENSYCNWSQDVSE